MLDDLEKIARVLGVKVVELFLSPGADGGGAGDLGVVGGGVSERRWCSALFLIGIFPMGPGSLWLGFSFDVSA